MLWWDKMSPLVLTSHPGTWAAPPVPKFQFPSSDCRCGRWRWLWRPHTTAGPWRSKPPSEQPPRTDPDGNLPLSDPDNKQGQGSRARSATDSMKAQLQIHVIVVQIHLATETSVIIFPTGFKVQRKNATSEMKFWFFIFFLQCNRLQTTYSVLGSLDRWFYNVFNLTQPMPANFRLIFFFIMIEKLLWNLK